VVDRPAGLGLALFTAVVAAAAYVAQPLVSPPLDDAREHLPGHARTVSSPAMALADDFQAVLDTLPPDWTDLNLDLRIFDEERYIEAATILVQINAAPYSKHDWHWRLQVAHEFGHAAAPETVRGTLGLLDDQGIEGELVARDSRSGRVEVVQMWGRPESVRREFARRRNQ
jgi:hypothetical protein